MKRWYVFRALAACSDLQEKWNALLARETIELKPVRRRKLRDRLPKLKAVSNSSDKKREKEYHSVRWFYAKIKTWGENKSSDKRKCERSAHMLIQTMNRYKCMTCWKTCRKKKSDLFHKTEHEWLSSGHNILHSNCFLCTSKSQNISQWTTHLLRNMNTKLFTESVDG